MKGITAFCLRRREQESKGDCRGTYRDNFTSIFFAVPATVVAEVKAVAIWYGYPDSVPAPYQFCLAWAACFWRSVAGDTSSWVSAIALIGTASVPVMPFERKR
jgi:hypothetical protein